MKVLFCCLLAALLSSGCARQAPEDVNAEKASRSTGELVVDGITGRGAVRAGKKARATIEQVSRDQKEMLDEVLEQ